MLETELIDHILKAAKDISSLHIIPAQVALKQAEFKLNKWKDLHPVTANQQPGMFFGMHKSNRFICSWLGELHQHLLAKFCLFFYSAFKDQKKHNSGKLIQTIIDRSLRDIDARVLVLIVVSAVLVLPRGVPSYGEYPGG